MGLLGQWLYLRKKWVRLIGQRFRLDYEWMEDLVGHVGGSGTGAVTEGKVRRTYRTEVLALFMDLKISRLK